MNQKIKKCSNHYHSLLNEVEKLLYKYENTENQLQRKLIKKKIDKAQQELDQYSQNTYAKVVYDLYAPITPMLIERRTGKECSWEKAFGNTFNSISPLRREFLVGLIEGDSKYKFK